MCLFYSRHRSTITGEAEHPPHCCQVEFLMGDKYFPSRIPFSLNFLLYYHHNFRVIVHRVWIGNLDLSRSRCPAVGMRATTRR
jgi:hypothetical protein